VIGSPAPFPVPVTVPPEIGPYHGLLTVALNIIVSHYGSVLWVGRHLNGQQ